MSYITRWLSPDEEYRARQADKLVKKTNQQFCEEVKAQIDKLLPESGATIEQNIRGEIAVFRFDRRYSKPFYTSTN